MAKILVIYHSLSGNTEAAARAVAKGARALKGTQVVVKQALKEKTTSININELKPIDIGKWVKYTSSGGNSERGRIKSWNDKWRLRTQPNVELYAQMPGGCRAIYFKVCI